MYYFIIIKNILERERLVVYWNEYFPVTGKGTIQITEDNNSTTNQASSPTERMNSIRHLLDKKQMSLYRRHIASRLA